MNTRTIAISAIVLWGVSVAVVAYKFVNGSTVTGSDGREIIQLDTSERTLVLGEMRGLLMAVQEIIAAVNAGDMDAVKASAHRVGSAEVGNTPPGLMLKFPIAFKTLGLATHDGFDEIAVAAESGPQAVLESLEENMGKCVACHEAYRFGE